MKDEDIGKVMRRAYEKNVDPAELKMLLAVITNTNDKGICATSNEKFAKRLKASPRSITGWLTALKDKRLVNIIQNKHRHERWIYINGLKFTKYETPEPEDMSPEQKLFHEAFPNKEIDCEVPLNVNMGLLINEIKGSTFLRTASNVTLKSCVVNHYDKIINGGYRDDVMSIPESKHKSWERNYSKEKLNNLFQTVDEIEI